MGLCTFQGVRAWESGLFLGTHSLGRALLVGMLKVGLEDSPQIWCPSRNHTLLLSTEAPAAPGDQIPVNPADAPGQGKAGGL